MSIRGPLDRLVEVVAAGNSEVYQDRAGKYRFRLKASNGQVVASGEAYESKAAALKGSESCSEPPRAPRSSRLRANFFAGRPPVWWPALGRSPGFLRRAGGECGGRNEGALAADLDGAVGVADGEVDPPELVYSRSLTGDPSAEAAESLAWPARIGCLAHDACEPGD
jgi:uncharacterized protein